MMKSTALLTLLAASLTPLTSAQILRDSSHGNLPSCAQQCSILTQAQSSCNGGSSASAQAWSCFCSTVYSRSGGALTTMCQTSCTSTSDNTLIDQWYTANCGSDNGASEHGSGSSGGGNGNGNSNNGGGSSPSSTAAGSSPSSTDSSSSGSSDGYTPGNTCTGSWFHCHWKWVVMVIVLAIALTALGVGGRYWKKAHDRKRDAAGISAFNPGITTRSAGAGPYPSQPPPGGSAQMSQVQDQAYVASGDVSQTGRNSPSRTRDAFMPYGYGYTRSESRLGNNGQPIPRGGTPVNEVEKGESGGKLSKMRKVMVRERNDE